MVSVFSPHRKVLGSDPQGSQSICRPPVHMEEAGVSHVHKSPV